MDDFQIKKEIENLYFQYKSLFDDETCEAIEHYIDHHEFEMAFEGLFIEIMKEDKWRHNKSLSFYLNLGIILSLDKESVFEVDFWSKLIKWSNKL
jgi:hypothetical protein